MNAHADIPSSGNIALDLHLQPKQWIAFDTPATEVLYGGAAFGGKALDVSTPIATPYGWTTMGEINAGDKVFDEHGKPCTVVAATPIMQDRECWRLTFSDGSQIVADADHQWVTWTRRTCKAFDYSREDARVAFPKNWTQWEPRRGGLNTYTEDERERILEWKDAGLSAKEIGLRLDRTANAVVQQWNKCIPESKSVKPITTSQIAKSLELDHIIPICGSLDTPSCLLPIDPYVLGYMLGDGDTKAGCRVACDPQDRDWLIDQFRVSGYDAGPYNDKGHFGVRGLSGKWRELRLNEGKKIPPVYLRASKLQRISLVQGLVDSDGYVDNNGCYRFTNTNKDLIDGFCELVTSLGCLPRVYTRQRSRLGRPSLRSWDVIVASPFNLARLPRKLLLARHTWKREQQCRRIVNAERMASVSVRCIQVDSPSHMYLAGRTMIPTHNSHLMRVSAITWCSEIPGLQVYLFRRIRDDLIKNHMEGPKGFRALLAPWTSTGICRIVENEIRFWNGAKIYLSHCEHETDIYKYQGVESHVLFIDELTHWTEPMYRFLRNRVRMVGITLPKQYDGRFPRILCGANPGNIGHSWVKRTFIQDAEPLKIRLMPAAEGGMLRQFIPARLEDNAIGVHDDPEYEARLEGLGSATLVAAMRWGDWDVVEGAFFDCWQHRKHVIAPFSVPKDWVRFRSADWGSASPGSIGWWAVVQDDFDVAVVQDSSFSFVQNDGVERVGNDGFSWKLDSGDGRGLGDNSRPVVLPRGALVRYREDYIASGPGKGLKLTAEQVADRIIERERDDPRLAYAVLDPSTFKEDGGPSIAERINTKLVKAKLPAFRKADNSRVTKIAGHGSGPMSGWDIMRQRMIGTGTSEDPQPTIFWFSTCLDSIRTIPALQHDPNHPEDLYTNSDDHCADDTRYACISRPWLKTKLAPEPVKDAYRPPTEEIPSSNFKVM